MKIEIDEEERQELLKQVLLDLHDDQRPGFIKWKSFTRNPIQEAFAKELKALLNPMIESILKDREFDEAINTIGRLYVRKYLKNITSNLILDLENRHA